MNPVLRVLSGRYVSRGGYSLQTENLSGPTRENYLRWTRPLLETQLLRKTTRDVSLQDSL